MYDLINYTEDPLVPKINENRSNNHKINNV